MERLIGSVRRECIDHVIVFVEPHLRRTHAHVCQLITIRLGKDTPISRPIERFGRVIAKPMVNGLHHRYART